MVSPEAQPSSLSVAQGPLVLLIDFVSLISISHSCPPQSDHSDNCNVLAKCLVICVYLYLMVRDALSHSGSTLPPSQLCFMGSM